VAHSSNRRPNRLSPLRHDAAQAAELPGARFQDKRSCGDDQSCALCSRFWFGGHVPADSRIGKQRLSIVECGLRHSVGHSREGVGHSDGSRRTGGIQCWLAPTGRLTVSQSNVAVVYVHVCSFWNDRIEQDVSQCRSVAASPQRQRAAPSLLSARVTGRSRSGTLTTSVRSARAA
jgi:hypothetical protein